MSEAKSKYCFSIDDEVIITEDCPLGTFCKGDVGVLADIVYDEDSELCDVKFFNYRTWVNADIVEPYVKIPKFATVLGADPSHTMLSVGQRTLSLTKQPFKQKYMKAYMENAVSWAKTSEATRLKVGCVIVDKESGGIIAQGCNGTPTGWHTNVCENEDSGETEWFVQHAEVNALNKLRKSPMSAVGSVVFVTHSPCKHCALQLIDAKVSHVYYLQEYRDLTGVDLLRKYGIIVQQFAI